VLEQVRRLFAVTSVSLVSDECGTTRRVATAGPVTDDVPTLTVPAGPKLALVAQGPKLFAEDRQLLSVLAASAARAWQSLNNIKRTNCMLDLMVMHRRGPGDERTYTRALHAALVQRGGKAPRIKVGATGGAHLHS
jgi:hypothetical protein